MGWWVRNRPLRAWRHASDLQPRLCRNGVRCLASRGCHDASFLEGLFRCIYGLSAATPSSAS